MFEYRLLLKQMLSLSLFGLLGLACYFAVWAVMYRFPVESAQTIDLRKSPADKPYCVSFCSSLADNPVGFPGHAYVVWSPSLTVNLCSDLSLGYMPRYFNDQIPSLFVPVKGALIERVKGNLRNLNRLSVIVSEKEYFTSLRLAHRWKTDDFKVGSHDCAAFSRYVASLLNLKTESSDYVYPQDYLSRLKRLNAGTCRPVSSGCFPALSSSRPAQEHQGKEVLR